MFVEQRLYTFAPGKSAAFNKLYEEQGRAPQERHLGSPSLLLQRDRPTQSGDDALVLSVAERPRRKAEPLFNDPEWISFLEQARALVVTQETRILKPAPFFRDRLKSFTRNREGIAMSKLVRAACSRSLPHALRSRQHRPHAQADYPSKPVKFVCRLRPAAASTLPRVWRPRRLAKRWVQQIVVQTRAEPGGAMRPQPYQGRSRRLHAALSLDHGHRAFGDHLQPQLRLAERSRSSDDHHPVCAGDGLSPTLPAKNMKEFVRALEGQSGQVQLRIVGRGLPIHLAAEFFLQRAGRDDGCTCLIGEPARR